MKSPTSLVKIALLLVVLVLSTFSSFAQWQELTKMTANGDELSPSESYDVGYAKQTEVIYGDEGGAFELEVLNYNDQIDMCLCSSSTPAYLSYASAYNGYYMSYEEEPYDEDLSIYFNGSLVSEIENSNVLSMKIEVIDDQVRFYFNNNIVHTLIDNNIPSHLQAIVRLHRNPVSISGSTITYEAGMPEMPRPDLGLPIVNLTDTYPGTSAAEGYYSSYSHANAFDNNLNTDWYDRESQTYIQYDFSTGYKPRVVSYSVSGTTVGYAPEEWTLSGSNDGQNWTVVDRRFDVSWSSDETKSFMLSQGIPEAYEMFRLFVTSTMSYRTRIAEFDLFGYQGYLPGDPQMLFSNAEDIAYQNGVDVYDTGQSKNWLIQPVDDGEVIFRIESFEPRYPGDVLIVYDGTDYNGTELARYSEELAQVSEVYSSGNSMYVEYISTDFGYPENIGSGLIASYQSTNQAAAVFPWVEVENVGFALQDHKLTVNSTNVNTEHELYVDGSIGAEEIVIEVVNAPDYVFEDDYDLSSLEEIDEYIEANGHLPEVPSAVEMEAQGVSLGEINMLLLKKIEELTLHLIDLNGKYDKVSSELQEIRKTNK